MVVTEKPRWSSGFHCQSHSREMEKRLFDLLAGLGTGVLDMPSAIGQRLDIRFRDLPFITQIRLVDQHVKWNRANFLFGPLLQFDRRGKCLVSCAIDHQQVSSGPTYVRHLNGVELVFTRQIPHNQRHGLPVNVDFASVHFHAHSCQVLVGKPPRDKPGSQTGLAHGKRAQHTDLLLCCTACATHGNSSTS